MANRPAPALVLRAGDRAALERRTRSDRVGARAAKRARIVLLAADGEANTRIAELTDSTVTTVLNWRGRYEERGIAGLADASKPGRPRELDHRAIVAETLKPPPKKLGVTHWLVDPAAGGPVGDLQHLGRSGVAVLRGQAVEGRIVPVLHRSGAGREGDRHTRRRPRALTEALTTCTGRTQGHRCDALSRLGDRRWTRPFRYRHDPSTSQRLVLDRRRNRGIRSVAA